MVWVMVVVRVMVRVRVECHVRVLIFPPEPSIECFKVSHVIFECRVINHHPYCIVMIFVHHCKSAVSSSWGSSFNRCLKQHIQ